MIKMASILYLGWYTSMPLYLFIFILLLLFLLLFLLLLLSRQIYVR